MTIEKNRRSLPRSIERKRIVFSGHHKPLPERKLKLKKLGPEKYDNFTLVEIRKLVGKNKGQ